MIESIVEQHAEEAAFLWSRRDAAVRAPHYTLADLTALDQRVEAHLDGLRVAGDVGWTICTETAAWEAPGDVFPAVVLAVERGALETIARVLDETGSSPGFSRGFVSALGWASFAAVSAILPGLFDPRCPAALQRLGIAACAAHRRDPGEPLARALFAEDLGLRARALRAAGELGRADLLGDVRAELGSSDERCRFAAAFATALLGDGGASPADGAALEVLWGVAFAGGDLAERACSLALRRGEPRAGAERLKLLAARGEHPRVALAGAAALGDPAFVPWLLDAMAAPELCRLAGESWSTITGIELRGPLAAKAPEGFSAGPSDDPAAADVAMDPDEHLPWPDVDALRRVWSERAPGLRSGVRHFLGRPLAAEGLHQVLREGGQRRRAGAALDLALLSPRQPLFEVRAPGSRQRRALDGG